MPARMFAKDLSVRAAIDAALAMATFAAGSLGALLLLDAHDALGVYSALLSFALRIVQVRYAGHAAEQPSPL
ncbi:MAG: hypothetical protein ACREE9_19115 [Stellaceae bacterium]